MVGFAAALVVGVLASQRVAAAGPGFWERVAASPQVEADRLSAAAEAILAADGDARAGAARAEPLVRRALALATDDFRALAALAEIDARAGRADAALAGLERACARAPDDAVRSCWFRLGVERSRRGRHAEAIEAYERRLDVDAPSGGEAIVHANLGELLMATGRLREAEDRYREALRADAGTGRDDRHATTLATYGLAVVLDRAGQTTAAREMMARALALDPKASLLEAARAGDGDVFFVPDGDVYYYLGLAAEVRERVDDAEAAFQEFGARAPKSPWFARARAHIAALEAHGSDGRRAAPHASPLLRVTAAGTVSSRGPLPAPLVDAAWRQRPGLVDACLDEAARDGLVEVRPGLRFALELDLDAAGAVAGVTVDAAPALAQGSFARCVEASLRAGLRVPRPHTPKPTHVRVELLVGIGKDR
ncbi:MAG TPA: tetratricopeptide repeat protein [Polyangia bacterium]|nr:tetratricopeptide repeat protein [Polyangia bacterium]